MTIIVILHVFIDFPSDSIRDRFKVFKRRSIIQIYLKVYSHYMVLPIKKLFKISNVREKGSVINLIPK